MTENDLHIGAQVYSSDGTEVGNLARVLATADGYEIEAIVVKEAHRFTGHWLSPGANLINDEFIVPTNAIKAFDHDRVELALDDFEVRRLAPYLSWREKGESLGEGLEDEAAALGSGPEVPHWLEEVANKPTDELEIAGGENVMLGHTGKKLGHVKDVLVDGDQLVGIVMLPEGIFRQEVIVPRRFLQRSDDAALFVKLTENDLKQLKPFRPQ